MSTKGLRILPRSAALYTALLCLVAFWPGTGLGGTQSPTIMSLPQIRPWTGDLDGMLKRRVVRILVPPNKTYFFLDRGEASGVAAELGAELEAWLNKRHARKPYPIHVAFIPTRRDRLLADLRAGKGDIAAGNLTITGERAALVDFAAPWAGNISEILVTGPSAPEIKSIDDLGGRDVMVRPSSSYYTHLQRLNERLKGDGRAPVNIVAADENLEDEDLLEMVSAGLLPWTIVDSHTAGAWAKILKGLTLRADLAVNRGGEIAWAVRKNSPLLQRELKEFVEGRRAGTETGNDIRLRYFTDARTIKNALARRDADKLGEMMAFFRSYGQRFTIDPFLLAAQGYQESRLDQSLRMKSGAVGVMQIKPTTAREKEIAINDVVTRAEDNIHAGAKYLRFLADRYVKDPGVDERNRVLMAIAAYNAGPGGLKKFIEAARKRGYDPNIWFQNVENGAAAAGGYETVQYVGNIYKYYIAYSLMLQSKETTSAIPKAPTNPEAAR